MIFLVILKKVYKHKSFIKSYNKRIKGNKRLEDSFKLRLLLLLTNPYSPKLRLHRLKGTMQDYYAVSLTGDIRIVLMFEDDNIYLIDIGSHNQVY